MELFGRMTMMNRTLKFTICATLLILSAPSFAMTEDGLCTVIGRFGRGTGFIVNDKFFTAAHVLEAIDETAEILCVQDGKLKNISSSVKWQRHLHPQSQDYSIELEQMDASRNTPDEIQAHQLMAKY